MIEMSIAAFTFLIIFGVGVVAVSRGMHIHAEASVKQSLQREIKAISAFLEADGSKTNFFRTLNEPRTTSSGDKKRDALAMVGMNSWQGDIALDALGLPAWDNLITYVATRDDKGSLIRQVVRPAATPIRDTDMPALMATALSGTLNAGDTLLNEKTLSKSVDQFFIETDASLGILTCEIALKESVVKPDGLGSQDEVLNVRIVIFPQNTWPRLN